MDGGVVVGSRLPRRPVRLSQRAGPDPTFLEGVAASFRTTGDEVETVQVDRLARRYHPIIDALTDMGVDPKTLRSDFQPQEEPDNLYSMSDNRAMRLLDYNRVWAAVEAARARDGRAFASLPKSKDEFERLVLTRDGDRARDQDMGNRAGLAARLVGGAAGSFQDPLNIITLPLGGGGKTILGTILREGIIAAGTEALTLPGRARALTAMGETMTAGDAARDVAAAGIGGGLLEGAGKAVAPYVGAAAKAGAGAVSDVATRGGRAAADAAATVRETGIAAVWNALPPRVRERWASAAEIGEDDLPELAELAIGRDSMSEEQRAALAEMARAASITAQNPFKPNGAGIAAHQDTLQATMASILSNAPPPRARVAGGPVRPRVAIGTTLGSGTVSGTPARQALKNRIGVVESGGGAKYANPLSSARGKYQFLDDTWVAYYTRRFGSQGLSRADMLAKRRDAGLQDVLMDDLLADNAAFLRSKGEAETAGNLYLAHFAGQGGAGKLFAADPDARAVDVLGAGAVKANPFLANMTAADVIRWAHTKMGEARPAPAGARVELAEGEGAYRAELQAEIDRLQAERLASAEAVDGAAPLPIAAELLSAEPVMADTDTPIGAIAEDVVRSAEPPVIAAVAAVVAPKRLASARRPHGVRHILAEAPDEERYDVLTVAARAGGLRDDAGHDLRGRGRLISGVISGSKRRAGGGGGSIPQFAPGGGHVFRKDGKSIDELGEALWELGWFLDRPDEAQVLDLLYQAATSPGKRLYHPNIRGKIHDEERLQDREARFEQDLLDAEPSLDRYLDPDELTAEERAAVLEDMVLNGVGAEDALVAHFERTRGDALAEAAEQDPGLDIPFDDDDPRVFSYDPDRDPFAYLDDADDAGTPTDPQGIGRPDRGRVGKPEGIGGDESAAAAIASAAYEGGARAADDLDGPDSEVSEASPQAIAAAHDFLDPDGPLAKAQADSVEHDLRAEAGLLDLPEAVDPAASARQPQQAELKAASPMRAAADQDSTIGMGLFDAADQASLDLPLDLGDDAPLTLRELLDGLDAEKTDIDTVRNCL
jgi:hypothetical protein